MTDFEDHLWSHLQAHGGDAAIAYQPPAGRSRRPILMLGGTLTTMAAIAVAVVIALAASNATPPAYAITTNPDGTITLTIRQLTNPAAINARLARLGARARLVPLTNACPAPPINLPIRYLQPSTQPWSTNNTSHGPVGNWTVGLIPRRIPAGQTLVFALREYHHRGWQSASGFVTGPAPRCAAARGSGLTTLTR